MGRRGCTKVCVLTCYPPLYIRQRVLAFNSLPPSLPTRYLIHCFRQLLEDKKKMHPDIRRRSVSGVHPGIIEPNQGVSALAQAARATLDAES